MAMKQKEKYSLEKIGIKNKGLFDHVKHIRQIQNPNYFDELNETEQKSFNKYMILRVLSMDSNIIEEISYISKYMEVLPEKQLYKLLIKCVPKDYKFYPYIKKSTKDPNNTLIDCICDKFKIGKKDAIDYYKLMISSESGINEMISLVEAYGFSEKEIEEIFEAK